MTTHASPSDQEVERLARVFAKARHDDPSVIESDRHFARAALAAGYSRLEGQRWRPIEEAKLTRDIRIFGNAIWTNKYSNGYWSKVFGSWVNERGYEFKPQPTHFRNYPFGVRTREGVA